MKNTNLETVKTYYRYIVENRWDLFPDLFAKNAVISLPAQGKRFKANEYGVIGSARGHVYESFEIIRFGDVCESSYAAVKLSRAGGGVEFRVTFFDYDGGFDNRIKEVSEFVVTSGDV